MASTYPCFACGAAIPFGNLKSGTLVKCPECKKDGYVPLQNIPRASRQPRCPKCTAKVSEEDSICGFCDAKLPGPNTRRMLMVEDYWARFRKIRKLVAVWCLALAGGVTWYLWPSSGIAEPEAACQSSLQFLHSLYTQVAGSKRPLPATLGSRFWSDLVTGELGPGIPYCNGGRQLNLGGATGYRGPIEPIATLPDNAVIACDFEPSHDTGVQVLLKNSAP
jgi:hypothetical protein